MNTEQKPDNPPLFFAWDPDRGDEPITTEVTLRDLFAGLAMAGNIASTEPGEDLNRRSAAEWAYGIADAMLEARGR